MDKFTYVLLEQQGIDYEGKMHDYINSLPSGRGPIPIGRKWIADTGEGRIVYYERFDTQNPQKEELYQLARNEPFGFILRPHTIPKDPVNNQSPWGEARHIQTNRLIAAIIEPADNHDIGQLDILTGGSETQSLVRILRAIEAQCNGNFPFRLPHNI